MVQTLPATELSFVIRDVGLSMTILESFVNGIYTMIFAYTLCLILSRGTYRHHRGPRLMIVIITVLYSLSIIHLASRWEMVRQAFVLDGSTANTILTSLSTPSSRIVISATLSLSLMTLIADCVMIWRCYVVWERDWRIPIAPFLATAIGSAFCALSLMHQIQPRNPYLPSNRSKFTQSGIIYFSLSLASTIMSTALIIYRIVTISRRAQLPSSYRGIIEIIAESAALYTIVMVIFLPFFAQKNFTQGYAQAVLVPVTGIAPTIVTARVSLGLSKQYETSKTVMPSLTNWDTSMQNNPAGSVGFPSSADSSSGGTRDVKGCIEYPPREVV